MSGVCVVSDIVRVGFLCGWRGDRERVVSAGLGSKFVGRGRDGAIGGMRNCLFG